MVTKSIKQQLYHICKQDLNVRLQTVKDKISDIQNSLQSETKSTAGDKHETGRAMLQLERERVGQQLAEIENQISILNRVNLQLKPDRVIFGSVVYTTKANYFISVSVGKIEYEEDSFYAISANTPIAKLVLSKSVGDTITFRDQQMRITKIL